MSLAQNLLNSLDGTSYQNVALSDQEEHIKVGQDRVITVPNALKNIAVKGDKDIETVTFDCVRYWDGHDLSTFAIYINYILPNGDEGTYIPESITRYEDVFSFDWEIGSEITYVPGKLTFWIVTKLTDDSGVLIKQWSSFQNSDCTIAQGGDKTYVPSQTDQDVISQAISISRASAEHAEEQANIATEAAEKAASDAKASAEEEVTRLVGELGVVQGTGISPTSVISQAGATRSFAHALNGKESGGAVLCEEVSPVLHPVVVGVRSENLLLLSTGVTEPWSGNGITITATENKPSFILNGTPTESSYLGLGSVTLGDNDYIISGGTSDYGIYIGGFTLTDHGTGAIIDNNDKNSTKEWGVRVLAGITYDNVVVKPMLRQAKEVRPFTPRVPNGTAVKVTSAGANLLYLSNTEVDIVGVHVKIVNGVVTISGTATASGGRLSVLANVKLPAGTYVSQGSSLVYLSNSANNGIVAQANGNPFTLSEETTLKIGINFTAGVAYSESFNVWINKDTALPYEPFKVGQTIDATVGSTIDLPSIAPYMSVYTDTEGTAVDVTYVKDTNAVVQKLVNAIVALGGNV